MVYLASHLDPARFRAEVCTFSDEPSVLWDQLAAGHIPVHTIRCREGLDVGAIVRVGKLIRATRATVVHCYNPRPILYGGVAAAVLGVRARVGSLSAFACQVPDRTYGFLPQPLTTKSRRNVLRNRISARLMCCLATVSESLGTRFCEYNGLPIDKLRVVPYGADLSEVDQVSAEEVESLRRQMGFLPEHVVVGSVGRLVEQKDYPTQLKAFANAAARIPHLRMVLAGDGPLADSLRQMVRAHGVDDRVVFLGHWSRVPALLRSLDIFVLASKFEPFGVAILEAKAAGVAIVATAVNEIPEIISDRTSGLLSPAEDPDTMAGAFVALATDPALRARLGHRARLEAEERHSLDAVVSAYQQLYASCVN
jgi:glycosyltransferase involved in cell wall biosynthesis